MLFRSLLLLLLCFVGEAALARELNASKIMESRYGNRSGYLQYTIKDFDYLSIDRNAKIFVTLDELAKPEDYTAAKIFTQAFQSNFPNATFVPQGDSSGYDLIIYIHTSRISESGSISVPTYRNEATGIDCSKSFTDRMSCVETGRKRVRSGSQEISTLSTLYGVTAAVYYEATDELLRESRSYVVLSSDDNCRNQKNVVRSLAHILGKRTFNPEPDEFEFRLYPNQLGCHDKEEITLLD